MFQRTPTKRRSGAGFVVFLICILGAGGLLAINGHVFDFFSEPKQEKPSNEDDPNRPILAAAFSGDNVRKAGDAVVVQVTIDGVAGRAFNLYRKCWLSNPIEKRPGLTVVMTVKSRSKTETIECSLYSANKAGMFVLYDHASHDGPGEVRCEYTYHPD